MGIRTHPLAENIIWKKKKKNMQFFTRNYFLFHILRNTRLLSEQKFKTCTSFFKGSACQMMCENEIQGNFDDIICEISQLVGKQKYMPHRKKQVRCTFDDHKGKLLYFSLENKWAASWQNQQNDLCAQRRLRSALAFTESDQSFHCPHEGSLDP